MLALARRQLIRRSGSLAAAALQRQPVFFGHGTLGLAKRTLATPAADVLIDHPDNNVSPTIASRLGTNLHLQEHHPLNNIKHIIETHFNEQSMTDDGQAAFKVFDGVYLLGCFQYISC